MQINIKIHPSSKIKRVEKSDKEDLYNIYVKSPARENKANKEAIEILSEFFNVPKSSIEITHGLKSKNKVVEIFDK